MKPRGMTNEELTQFHYLVGLRLRRDTIEILIMETVKWLVASGCSWREVGDALGTSGQAAWAKYRLPREE